MGDLLPSVFELLLEMKWKGVSFPTSHLAIDLEHDLVEHKWPDRDGAHVEATGRSPLVFSATIPFRNGIAPGKTEKWGILYPTGFRDFLTKAADRTVGDLQHPELGVIKCKLKSARVTYDPNKRDGADVDATWIESTETPEDLQKVLASSSPVGATLQFALDLDQQLLQLNPPLPTPPGPPEPSFGDAIRSIQGAFDQTSLLSRQIAGQIDHVAYRLSSLSDSVAAAKNVLFWPVTQSVEHMRASLNDLKSQLLVQNKQVSIYVVPAETTLANIAAFLGVRIDDIVKLNPLLVSSARVAARSTVRYYG